jgi:hypothetical protein
MVDLAEQVDLTGATGWSFPAQFYRCLRSAPQVIQEAILPISVISLKPEKLPRS